MKNLVFLLPIILVFVSACDYSDDYGSFNNNYSGNGNYNGNGDQYTYYGENPFTTVTDTPISTFSIDADGASYSNMRRFLNEDQFPPKGSIRIEELINYFSYNYPEPTGSDPIAVLAEVAECPWKAGHKLIKIGIKGKTIETGTEPPANLVFLIDVSGSMSSPDKLELVKFGLNKLVDQLRDIDHVAIVTYAGYESVALQSTSGNKKSTIKNVINNLSSGGSTAGAEGIKTAYEIAEQNFITGGNNRVILATDGDFNVGISNTDELVKLIEKERETGIFLTVVGVGRGNLNDAMMEQLADNGNGTYEYIDSESQAEKVFVYEMGKFYTVAKDVKIQIVFDPENVEKYRLIGYENRLLQPEDFVDDTKDAGEIGSGQAITAIYEIIPREVLFRGNHPFQVDFRYKEPDADDSKLISVQAVDNFTDFVNASEDFRFAASVAAFGMLLNDSQYDNNVGYDNISEWVSQAKTFDPAGYKTEFIELIKKAKTLDQ